MNGHEILEREKIAQQVSIDAVMVATRDSAIFAVAGYAIAGVLGLPKVLSAAAAFGASYVYKMRVMKKDGHL